MLQKVAKVGKTFKTSGARLRSLAERGVVEVTPNYFTPVIIKADVIKRLRDDILLIKTLTKDLRLYSHFATTINTLFPFHSIIVIFQQSIRREALKNGVSVGEIVKMVLVHEYAHALNKKYTAPFRFLTQLFPDVFTPIEELLIAVDEYIAFSRTAFRYPHLTQHYANLALSHNTYGPIFNTVMKRGWSPHSFLHTLSHLPPSTIPNTLNTASTIITTLQHQAHTNTEVMNVLRHARTVITQLQRVKV